MADKRSRWRCCALLLCSIHAILFASAAAKLSQEQLQELLLTDKPVGEQDLPLGKVLVLSIPYGGHALPVIRLAHEMARRGHDVTFSSTDDLPSLHFGKHIDWQALGVKFLPAGPPTLNVTQRDENDQIAVKLWRKDLAQAIKISTLTIVDAFHRDICGHLIGKLGLSPGAFDLVVTDMLTTCGFDVAQHLNVPLAVFHPVSLLAMMADDLPLRWDVPVAPMELPVRMGVRDAVTAIFTYLIIPRTVDPQAWECMERARAALGLVPGTVRDYYKHKVRVRLHASAPGLDAPMPLPPHAHLVGPMIWKGVKLTDELRKWLEEQPGVPVIYTAFGTLVDYSDENYEAIAQALGASGARVLWSAKPGAAAYLDKARKAGTLPANIRIEGFVPQVAVLLHPAVRVFLCHGGYNSLSEGLYAGKPAVLLPGFADNAYNSFRAQEQGAGLLVDAHLPALQERLSAALARVLTEPSFTAAAQRVALILRTAGGASRASEVLESVMALGTADHLHMPDNRAAVAAALALLLALPAALLAGMVVTVLVCVRRWRRSGTGAAAAGAHAKEE